jgi:uncharacterized protein (DUF697 family)
VAKKQQKSRGLPIDPKAFLEAVGLTMVQGASQYQITILVDTALDPAFVAYAREAFRPQTDNIVLSVLPYAEDVVPLCADDVLLVMLAREAAATGEIIIRALREQIPVLVVTPDPQRLQEVARRHYREIDSSFIVTVEELSGEGVQGVRDRQEYFAQLFAAFGERIVRELGDEALALARAFSFVRTPFVNNAIQAISLQNAAIAAVFFLPGADMPLLTLNQARLFLQIAAAYDAALDQSRLKELLVVLLTGFGLRALARRLLGAVPVLGWAIRGTVSYAGTLAIGKAAQEYFENGGSLKTLLEEKRFRSKVSGAQAGQAEQSGQTERSRRLGQAPDAN